MRSESIFRITTDDFPKFLLIDVSVSGHHLLPKSFFIHCKRDTVF